MLRDWARKFLPLRVKAVMHALIGPEAVPRGIASEFDSRFLDPRVMEESEAKGVRAIFDVGANSGDFGISMARRYPRIRVFAFEPTPTLVARLRDAAKSLPNYEVVAAAVSSSPGRAAFNIAGQADWGCSSLLTFSGALGETWPGRSDFNVTDVQQVDVIRLDDFIEQRCIGSIAYLHIDAQGCDLDVLRSVGRFSGLVERGCLEAATSRSVVLYKGAHSLEDVVAYMTANGFEIERLLPNDGHYNEVNVYFRRGPEQGHARNCDRKPSDAEVG